MTTLHLPHGPLLPLLLLLASPLSFLVGLVPVQGQAAGLVHTESGYDNWNGALAICWSASQAPNGTAAAVPVDEHGHSIVYSNPLVPDFVAGPTTLQDTCASGSELFFELDWEPAYTTSTTTGSKLRTHEWYSYQLYARINLSSLRQRHGLSSQSFFYSTHTRTGTTNPQIALRLVFCPVNGNLCSPFVLDAVRDAGQLRTINAHIHQPQLIWQENLETTNEDGHDHAQEEIYSYQAQYDQSHHGEEEEEETEEDHHDHDHYLRRRRRRLVESHDDHNNHRTAVPTILELLEKIEHALGLMETTSPSVSYLRVDYDETLGYPTRIEIEYEEAYIENNPYERLFSYAMQGEAVYLATVKLLEPSATTTSTTNSTSTDSTRDDDEVNKFTKAKALWMEHALADYKFQYNVHFKGDVMVEDDTQAFLPPSDNPPTYPWRVRVQNGQVLSVLDANNQTFSPVHEQEENHEYHHDVGDATQHEVEHDGDNHDHQELDNPANEEDHEGDPTHEDPAEEHDHGHDDHGASLHDQEHAGEQEGDNHNSNEEVHTYDDDHVHGDEHEHVINEAYHQGIADTSAYFAAASQVFFIEILPTNETDIFEISYAIDVQVMDAGDYLPMAHVQFFLSYSDTTDAAVKIDMANLLQKRQVTYYDPIDINMVSNATAILSYILIACCGAVQLYFLAATYHFREESVMKLSQGHFLVSLLAAGLMAQIGSIFYQPKTNVYCYLSGPLTHIPMQFMLAVILGRLRRIISIMAPLMDWENPKSHNAIRQGLRTWRASMMMGRGAPSSSTNQHTNSSAPQSEDQTRLNQQNKSNSFRLARQATVRKIKSGAKKLRRQYTELQLWIFVVAITTPVAILEVVALIVSPPDLELILNDEESIGRYQCGDSTFRSFQWASLATLLVTLGVCLYQVQGSSQLPALFNEASSVSSGLVSTLFVATLGAAMRLISEDPSSSPDMGYIMDVLIVLVVTLNLSLRLILPEMKLIWKGEKVVVSRMLQEHRQTVRQKAHPEPPKISGLDTSFSSAMDYSHSALRGVPDFHASGNTGMGFSNPGTIEAHGITSHHIRERASQIKERANHIQERDAVPNDDDDKGKRAPGGLPSVSEDKEQVMDDHSFRLEEIVPQSNDKSNTARSRSKKRVVIREGQDPPSQLTANVINHTNEIARIKGRILQGLQVDRDEWESLKSSIDEIHSLMADVEYEAPSKV